MSEIDNISWISQAFEQLDNDIEEVNQKVEENGRKLDIIIKHLTGLSDNQN